MDNRPERKKLYRQKDISYSANDRPSIYGGVRFVALAMIASFLILNLSCRTSATSVSENSDAKALQAAKNRAAIESAKKAIEQHRKGEIRIRVVDGSGRPVPDAHLEIKQLSHDFKFGCYLKIDDLDPAKLPDYERNFSGLFNYAVIGTYWDATENRHGEENWTWFDRETELALSLELRIQAAPILWGTNKYGTPAWLPREKKDLAATLERRVKSVVTKNEKVTDLEIVNEPLARKNDVFASLGTDEYISAAFKTAQQASPNGRRLLNEYGVFGSLPEHNYNRDRYLDLVQRLLANGVPIDVIGIQAHANGEWYEPSNVAEQLVRYSTLGKPIQITEFSAQTRDYYDRKTAQPISGKYREGVWDGDRQAEFYREFYTVAFGNPNVEAITTWGLDDERAWLPGIGLISENGAPKPAYRELERLINSEWKTNSAATTDTDGRVALSGFFGKYEVTATTKARKKVSARFTLSKDNPNNWVVHLG